VSAGILNHMILTQKSKQKRIGIFAGVFNPVHAGHIAFALQAIESAQLDSLYFVPERRPYHKSGVEHYAHRVGMLKKACAPYRTFGVIELSDMSLTIKRTVPQLQQRFAGADLIFIFGSNAIASLPFWPHAQRFLLVTEFLIGVRGCHDAAAVSTMISSWTTQPKHYNIIESYAPNVSSTSIRTALQQRSTAAGLLASVARYSDRHWLYVSLQ
jgi:nicotinate-nucleotide adenylyltransferase